MEKGINHDGRKIIPVTPIEQVAKDNQKQALEKKREEKRKKNIQLREELFQLILTARKNRKPLQEIPEKYKGALHRKQVLIGDRAIWKWASMQPKARGMMLFNVVPGNPKKKTPRKSRRGARNKKR